MLVHPLPSPVPNGFLNIFLCYPLLRSCVVSLLASLFHRGGCSARVDDSPDVSFQLISGVAKALTNAQATPCDKWCRLHGAPEMYKLSVKWKWKLLVVSDSFWPHGLYSLWNSPGQNTGVGSRSLFQGIFPTQGLNPGLLHCRWILYQLSHKISSVNGT